MQLTERRPTVDQLVAGIEMLPVAAYMTDAEGRITAYNRAAVRLWGRTPSPGERWCGSWRIRSINGMPLPHDQCPMALAIKENRPVRGVEAYAERPDGSAVRIRPHPTPVHDREGNLTGAINVLVDAGDRPLSARGLRDAPGSPERWSSELLAMQSAITAAGGDLDRIMNAVVEGALCVMPHAAGAVVEMREGEEFVYRAASGSSADKIELRLRIAGSLSGYCVLTGETQVCDDSEIDPRVNRDVCRVAGVRSMIVVPLPFQGTYVGVLKIYASTPMAFDSRDLLTAQLLVGPIAMGLASAAHADAYRAQVEADKRFAATFDQAAVGIAHTSADGRYLLVNDRFCEITGYTRDELISGGFQQITHPDDLDADLRNVAALIQGRCDHYSIEKRYIHKRGALVWVNLTVSLVRHADSKPDFFVVVIEDISTRKAAEQAAAHDGLTGLLNRRGLLEKLTLELGRHRVAGRPLTVAYLDLDGFKAINDLFGHLEGDRCLTKVAEAMRAALPPTAMLARFGGDEFVVLLPMTSQRAAHSVLAKVREAVVLAAEGEAWQLAVSVGAVIVRPDLVVDATKVISAADGLMYRAKRSDATEPVIATLGAT